ncbi:60S acidic ribosomal protein P1 [Hysterangium stoloniferum]|nr:60S acidic ribosomal protein P1 [Hysterangium stoloniferum]
MRGCGWLWVKFPTPIQKLSSSSVAFNAFLLYQLLLAQNEMATSELATSYACLILADEGIEITSDKIIALTSAANVEVEPIWASLLAKALQGKNIKDLLSNVGSGGGAPAVGAAAPAAGGAPAEAAEVKEEKKVEEKEESDDDMGFSLFD